MPNDTSVSSLRRSSAGFLCGLIVFVALNALVAQLQSDCGLLAVLKLSFCHDDIRRVGFPLQFYEEGGFGYHRWFDRQALAVDIATGLALGAVGWLIAPRFRRPKTTGPAG